MSSDPIPQSEFDRARDKILASSRVLIISHKNPDADSVGANLALREVLESLGKTVTSACADPVPENCDFLYKADTYQNEFSSEDYDLIISVDCGSHYLLKFHEWKPELLDRTKTYLINIDHHSTNDFFGNINLVMVNTPATCFILYLFFAYCGWEINKSIATSLLHGLYYDTGSFMHSNTSSDVLRVAARLKAHGADHELCVKKQFHTTTVNKLRLWGRVLSRSSMNDNHAVVSALTKEDFIQENMDPEDLSGVIGYLNSVPEAKFCVLLSEDLKGNIKGSLRTQKDDVDVAKVANLFGGGGHKKAAGFTVPGRLKERMTWEIS